MTDVQELMKRLQSSLCPNKLQEEIKSALQQMAAEVERLKAENTNFCNVIGDLSQFNVRVIAERDALKAKLDEAEKQEPVATAVADITNTGYIHVGHDANIKFGDKLYTRPIPAQDVNAGLVSMLMKARDGLSKGLWDYGPGQDEHEQCNELIEEIDAALSQSQAAPARVVADDSAQKNGIAWAVSRWKSEVENRPLVNKHRRTLDDTWRQVVRYFEGDPVKLLGPSHDDLLAAAPQPHEGAQP